MVTHWRVVFTRQAQKDAKKISAAGLRPKVEYLLDILSTDPFQSPPRFEELVGDLEGAFSRRINIHHRLIYQIHKQEKVLKVLPMWTHYQ